MRIQHADVASFIQGKVSEQAKVLRWIEEAQKIDPSIEIVADECDEDETSYTVISGSSENQKERQETFQIAKGRI